MIDFDIRTASLIIFFLYFLLPVITWNVLKEQSNTQLVLWCLGGLLFGVSVVLAGQRDTIPLWLSVSVAAHLFLFSNLMRIQSLRFDLNIPWKTRSLLFFIIVFSIIFEGLHYGLHNYILRAQFNFTIGACLLMHLAYLAKKIGQQEHSISAKWIACVYGLVAFVMLLRVVFLFSYQVEPNILQEGLTTRLLVFSMLVSSLIGHLGYVGLRLDRSRRRELQIATENARAEENMRLGELIAHLDRRRTLDQLSMTLSHELNQPLTAILTNAQAAKLGLHADGVDKHQIDELLTKIVFNTTRASQIIVRSRDFIRPKELHKKPVDLNQVISETIELIGSEAGNKNIGIQFTPSNQAVQILGDAIQISQIILIILRNAIHATEQSARRLIQLSCYRLAGSVHLLVRDTGHGFSVAELKKAGTPFFTTKPNGLGLGLCIAKSIVEHHGGKLTISNVADEVGSGALTVIDFPAYLQADHEPV